jgi:hypothetical protein
MLLPLFMIATEIPQIAQTSGRDHRGGPEEAARKRSLERASLAAGDAASRRRRG